MRKLKENLLKSLIYLSAFFTVSMLVVIVGYIFIKGIGGVNLSFLTSDYSADGSGGILPMIVTTVYTVILSIAIATPIGILSAIYLQEYAKKGKVVNAIRFATESLAGIPSIIYGLFGGIFFVVVLNLKTYEDVKHSIKILGELTGQKEKGLKIASELDKKVQNTVKQLPKNTKRVAILHSSAQNVTLEKENSIAGCVAKLLQLHNIVQDIQSVTAPTGEQMSDKAPYNLEFLIEKDPEIIFITSMGDKNDIEVRLQNDVMSSPAWESITAVKNNAVYYLPDELFLLNPGLRYSQAVEYMASKLQE